MTEYKEIILSALGEMELDGLNVGDLDANQSLLQQGLDSLDMMDLYFQLEEKTGKKIEFDDDTAQHTQWTTITDIAEGLAKI